MSFSSFGSSPSSVNLAVFFWVEPLRFNILQVTDRVATGIKLALDEAGIDMPYPHRVVLFHNQTGGRAGDIEAGEQPPKEAGPATARPPHR